MNWNDVVGSTECSVCVYSSGLWWEAAHRLSSSTAFLCHAGVHIQYQHTVCLGNAIIVDICTLLVRAFLLLTYLGPRVVAKTRIGRSIWVYFWSSKVGSLCDSLPKTIHGFIMTVTLTGMSGIWSKSSTSDFYSGIVILGKGKVGTLFLQLNQRLSYFDQCWAVLKAVVLWPHSAVDTRNSQETSDLVVALDLPELFLSDFLQFPSALWWENCTLCTISDDLELLKVQ